MIVYLIISIILFTAFLARFLRKDESTYKWLLLGGGIFFLTASVLSFLEFLMKGRKTILDVIIITVGAVLIFFIIRYEKKNRTERRDAGFEDETDKLRYEIINNTKSEISDRNFEVRKKENNGKSV